MKRSEINHLMMEAKEFFHQCHFHLPPWAFWSPSDWKDKYETCSEIIDHQLGWDITDFGRNDFSKYGLLLFTIRNGSLEKGTKKYSEKVMIVNEEQVTPLHFHWSKTEDIINRGGGNLMMELYLADNNDHLTEKSFTISMDGITRNLNAGDKLTLTPGESITLVPFLTHLFYGEKGKGKVLVGEVSSVNDDKTDNCFIDEVGRFPLIDEDEEPLHLLVSDYPNYI
ncbi:MAG: sugar ABC transporter [Bacteroides sp. SM23_62_1]|nr:MAG: sugar ABC transporter [Bacteroides sp. SM23_62_1]